MDALDGKMPQRVRDTLTERLAQAFEDCAKATTIRAEEIRVGDDMDDALIRIAAADRRVPLGHIVLNLSCGRRVCKGQTSTNLGHLTV